VQAADFLIKEAETAAENRVGKIKMQTLLDEPRLYFYRRRRAGR
jgi:hypothetical protein